MDIRILMIADDPCYVLADVQLLRDKGFRVYTIFNYENLPEVAGEIKPHILLYNLQTEGNTLDKQGTVLIKNTDGVYATIHTIAEDDIYMIMQPVVNSHKKSIILADSLIAAVKTALRNVSYTPKAAIHNIPQAIHLHMVSA